MLVSEVSVFIDATSPYFRMVHSITEWVVILDFLISCGYTDSEQIDKAKFNTKSGR